MTLYEPPVSHVLTALLVSAGASAAAAGIRMMSRALGRGDALHLVRGIRVLILGVIAGLAALTFATGNTGFLVIGLLILAEEIYETGMLAAIIRLGDRTA
jgi:hypothetical protein